MIHVRLRSSVTALAAILAAPLAAQGSVSPMDQATYEGSSSTSYPLGRFDARLQQLHADLGTAATTISGHAYRRDAISTRGQVAGYQVEMSVSLSMSPLTPSQASGTFADNVGTAVVVLPRTWVSFPATNRPPSAPASTFELRIPYATPFSYPSGGGTLCVDTTVYSNTGPNGANRNFTAYQDAHQLFADGRAIQPGYRYGAGCSLPGGGPVATAMFELRRLPGDMEFDIQARNGAPTGVVAGVSSLLVGFQATSMPIMGIPGCQLLTSTESNLLLPGINDDQGDWSGTLSGFAPLPTGLEFFAQIASGRPGLGVTLSDASRIVMPPMGPTPVPAARIANGTDHTSPTGTVSTTVPVTSFF